jgi:very-short-patch-repair endonuclease
MDPHCDISQSSAKVRVGAVAEKAWGRINWAQLRALGVPETTISAWVDDGYLRPRHPRVYAVGHSAGPIEADLSEALLYAGPGAMLSHQTAAWWWKLTDRKPQVIHVSTPRRCLSRPGIKVHGRRKLPRVWHNGLTVTTLAQTLLDCAAKSALEDVRYFLAEADFHWRIDLTEVAAIAGHGKRGSEKLRKALAVHWPELARTDSPPEREFLFLIEAGGLPRPKVNVRICGLKVDAYWPEYGVAVEIDGGQGHGMERQVARDHGRDLTLRAAGIIVRRYARRQIRREGARVLADLRAAGLP